MAAVRPTRGHYVYWEQQTTRWADIDVYGHMNNARYFEIIDTVVNNHLEHATGVDIRHAARRSASSPRSAAATSPRSTTRRPSTSASSSTGSARPRSSTGSGCSRARTRRPRPRAGSCTSTSTTPTRRARSRPCRTGSGCRRAAGSLTVIGLVAAPARVDRGSRRQGRLRRRCAAGCGRSLTASLVRPAAARFAGGTPSRGPHARAPPPARLTTAATGRASCPSARGNTAWQVARNADSRASVG